ncbi:inosine-5-monophosphate dehydrogenase [Sorangium cellulosum]|uniref:Inosine-5-monophosphate dehydrogenase n=1 Tax=Sorangium cellulosum TaxID=56 RepID=A0A2L0FAR3_SORCE|nr:CBS domain-containing protein [Sorangium cellulosum]AUX48670.1 inosine-5-monophosphate dehydrogenase [Sorangium cellulosum]
MDSVGEVLNNKGRTVYTISPESTVFEAVQWMCARHVGALLVSIDGSPSGIISERDVMTRVILARRDPAKTLVADVMTREVVCVEPGTPARQAMAVMTERRCRHLPVVEDGRVIGMISIGDLVHWASHEQEAEIKMLTEYVQGVYS